ncbi:major capsid protein, N4-gp56 family [Gemmobacter megaterium]|uniref:Major capsid protein, N4-gp56 family n=1 Tax=Gemmobacter megaterium TaxID=1086013 RepID=A0A1N7QAW4_9RHOB|nr:N4-gp56 family major capsid protein [Gemmobacter megaterium]GGE24247.1 major capsid protein [Gemmobacter megaterium]SIT20033.1 major capsid protein, N4-gp56 family [Gemmobacter megaterium]
MLTTVGVNSPQAVKRWATSLALEADKQTYYQRFIGSGENNIIERRTDLEDDAGDAIKFDLSVNLRGGVTTGDNVVEGTEEPLTFYQDEVKIDQVRKGASGGGRMTRKRTLHDLRRIARDRTATYMAEWVDEGFHVYLSGAPTAANQDSKFSGEFAGNPIQAPDSDHQLYGGTAVSKATLTAADKMNVALIERVTVKPRMMNATNPDVMKMTPVSIEGAKRFILLMSPFQAYDMRVETGDLSWSKIQQALATSEGRNSPIVKGGLGMINDTVLHQHEGVRRFSDYGVGGNVSAARSLLMGRQAGVVAYGSGGRGTRFTWVEKMFDADNQVAIYCGAILGMKKTRFNGKDFGVIAVDTSCRDPNAA